MIYSRWRPDRGGYDYFESSERIGIANDMPVPTSGGGTNLGVASVTVGRRPSGPVRYIGSGALARGAIMPTDTTGLSGLDLFSKLPSWAWLAVGGALGWALSRWKR